MGRARALWLVGTATALLVAWRLAAALPEVPNRHALTYDAARRALLDVDAADALTRLDPARVLWDVAGPEQWPTLRLLVAAPAHALAGPARALGVELGVSVAFVALLVLGLALSATVLASGRGEALALFAISCPLLLGNRDLLEHAADGMLEVPAAVFTLGATVAWIHAREVGSARPWSLALLGNALFHVKFQYGLFLAAAVLLTETLGPGGLRRLAGIAGSLLGALRRPWGLGVLVLGLGTTLLAAWLVHTGGVQTVVLDQAVSLGRPRVVRWLAAVSLFAFVSLAFFVDRSWLAALLPRRLRFAWGWLLTPMVLWLLVPFTWRLETLVASTTFDAGTGPLGLVPRLLFYPRAAWAGWFPPDAAWIALALLGLTLATSLWSPWLRTRLAPIAAVVGVELAALSFLAGRNFQPRLSVNLAPLVALVAALWAPEIRRPWLRTVLAAAAASVLLVAVLPGWRRAPLVAVMGRGFESRENGDACREVARALPLSSGELVNETHASRLQLCNLWVKLLARERGDRVLVRERWTAPGSHTVLLLTDGTQAAGPRTGWTPLGPEATYGVVHGALYRVDPPRSRAEDARPPRSRARHGVRLAQGVSQALGPPTGGDGSGAPGPAVLHPRRPKARASNAPSASAAARSTSTALAREGTGWGTTLPSP